MDLDLARDPVNDPVLLHSATGIEVELGFAVAALVGASRREDFDNQLRRLVEFAVGANSGGAAFKTDPDYIRRYIVIVSEDDSRSKDSLSESGFQAPILEEIEGLPAGVLVMEVGLFGHE